MSNIFWFSEKGDIDMVKKLISERIDVNSTDDYGQSALIYASNKGHIGLVFGIQHERLTLSRSVDQYLFLP